jgi:hypothetical protein
MPVALAAKTFTLASPALFAAAVVLALVCVAIAIVGRIGLPRSATILFLLGLACLCLAAGGLTWQRRDVGHVAVVVDISPSTATATYHDGAKLESRVKQLLGRTPFTLYQLADGVTPATAQSPREMPRYADAYQTKYDPPPAADAVVLFSDAQFAPTPPAAAATTRATSPQTFVVLDAALDHPNDAAVERVEVRGGDTIVATVRNAGPDGSRQLTMLGTDVKNVAVPAGRSVVTGTIAPDARDVTVFLRTRDPWMANNGLSVRVPPPPVAQKWWIGAAGAGAGRAPSGDWIHIDPANASADLADYLAPAVIVLDNVAADALAHMPRLQMQRYVRDLGGGIVILGGDRAFAAGGYSGTPLEEFSPLASTPPKPAAQWLLLADSSGSMARTLGDNSRWSFAVHAIGQVIPRLPADDTISVGNFSQALRWWIAGKSVRDAQAGFAIPKELRPHGPTNLAAALRLIADTSDGTLPTHLLLITDAEAQIDNVSTLAAALLAKRIRVSVLTTEKIASDNPLTMIANHTGGKIVGQSDPRKWARELKDLMRSASPPWLGRETLLVRRTEAGPRFAPVRVAPPWNRTWLKRDATSLADGAIADAANGAAEAAAAANAANAAANAERIPAIAAWNVGSGAVISAAFSPSPALVEMLVDRVAAPPRDPRFRVTYDAARELRITLDAIDNRAGGGAGGSYMNNLAPRVELSVDATRSSDAVAMPQTAPGRYEVALPAPSRATFASVRLGGRVIDRFAVAGRYPPEAEAIGNDRPAMDVLARATGGAVIEPSHTAPLDFRWPTRAISLSAYLAAAGAALIVSGLVRWRM